MKNLKNKIMSCVLAAVTIFSVSTAFKKFAPVTASAATAALASQSARVILGEREATFMNPFFIEPPNQKYRLIQTDFCTLHIL